MKKSQLVAAKYPHQAVSTDASEVTGRTPTSGDRTIPTTGVHGWRATVIAAGPRGRGPHAGKTVWLPGTGLLPQSGSRYG